MQELNEGRYFSLATFRKSGTAVPTPVWYAEVDGRYYVFSAGDAGKVKRLRNGNKARVALCDARGGLLGDWHEATARLFDEDELVEKAHRALRAKYGWQMILADLGAKLTGRYNKRQFIEISLT